MREPVGRIVPFGDRALLVETADVASAHALAGTLQARNGIGNAPAGVDELVIGWASVLVVLDPRIGPGDAVTCAAWVTETARTASTASTASTSCGKLPRSHLFPVVFDGADLDEVAAAVGLPLSLIHI